MESLLFDVTVLSVEKTQKVLANLRHRQLELALAGKIEQSAEYAKKAGQVRQAIQARLHFTVR